VKCVNFRVKKTKGKGGKVVKGTEIEEVDPFFKQNVLVFLKYFDKDTESFITVGDLVVNKAEIMEELLNAISQKHYAIIKNFDEGKLTKLCFVNM
jgi:molybdopterin-guanine dinucleotide biosynthesis protein A